MGMKRKRVTILPAGADGAAAGEALINFGRPGRLIGVAIDYQNQPATADVTVKADSSSGAALFTKTDNNTDVPLATVTKAGLSETGGAGAAGSQLFLTGLHVAVAQGDAGATKMVVVDVVVEV